MIKIVIALALFSLGASFNDYKVGDIYITQDGRKCEVIDTFEKGLNVNCNIETPPTQLEKLKLENLILENKLLKRQLR